MRLNLIFVLLLACRPDDSLDDTGLSSTGTDGGSADGGTGDGGTGDGGTGDGGTGDGGTGDGACESSPLLGSWLSQGSDLSPLFQSSSFDYEQVSAEFIADCSYIVVARTNDGDEYTIAGTWAASGSVKPFEIVQTQSSPYEATAEGIWQVQSNVLTLEVVQTEPDYGFSPPTTTAGFGSTSGQGLTAGDNVQIYRVP